MDYKKLQEPLQISDIDFRVQSINKGGYATILAYKDARVDMNRLDEVLGAENWQRDVKLINGVLFGGVGIYNDKINEWIWKWDAGTESNTEKEKGQSSDAFKRACFNLGIGRELYNYPIISVKLKETEFDKQTNKPTWNFKLKEWVWLSQFTGGVLTFLAAKDSGGEIRFKWGSFDKDRANNESTASGAPEPAPINGEEEMPTHTALADDANVDGFLKNKETKEPTAEEVLWSELAKKYEALFDKSPRSNLKIETLQEKIAEEEARLEKLNETPEPIAEDEEPVVVDEYVEIVDEEDEEEEEDVPTVDPSMYGGVMAAEANKISTFTDKEEFKLWAVSVFKKYAGQAEEAHISEFKEACNTHFEKIG